VPHAADELTRVTEDSARGGFFLFSGATLATVIMAISAIVIGRLMGHALYGQYNLALVLPSLLLLFTDLGINAGITKFAASLHAEGKDESAARIIRHGTIFRLLVGIVVFIVGMVFANYLALIINRPDSTFFIQIASISLVFQVLFTSSTSAFVGLDRTEYTALATNVQAAVKTILQVALVLLGFGITGALIGLVGGYIIASIMAGAILFLKLVKSSKNQDK
jgi:O-antigen/teichoic acid export membrane protein